jgi:hypothetical protein
MPALTEHDGSVATTESDAAAGQVPRARKIEEHTFESVAAVEVVDDHQRETPGKALQDLLDLSSGSRRSRVLRRRNRSGFDSSAPDCSREPRSSAVPVGLLCREVRAT